MNRQYRKFLVDSERVANDLRHRRIIRYNMSKYDAAVEKGKLRYSDLEKAKLKVAYLKRKALKNLDKLLLEFEERISKRGVEVLWASDGNTALEHVKNILQSVEAKLLVKSKSMTTEELDFNEFVAKIPTEPVDTDLGEYIVQLAGEKPYHIVTPAMHKSREDVNSLFSEKFGLKSNLSAEALTDYVRQKLRQIYQLADVGVTGANFIIADIGGIAVTENEGNALMSTAFPKIHIAIAGIEKLIPSIRDLGHIWPVLAIHGTGQSVTVYNSIFTGPRKDNEDFGPEKMFVILLDNKRSSVLAEPLQSDALACIRCGACLNACPVYRNIGGYTYNVTYSGPIGSVISPFFNGFKDFAHLSSACSICGKCTEVCPSKIDLHRLLLHNRNREVNFSRKTKNFTILMKFYRLWVSHSKLYHFDIVPIKNFFIKYFGRNAFGKSRELPLFKTSFRNTFKK